MKKKCVIKNKDFLHFFQGKFNKAIGFSALLLFSSPFGAFAENPNKIPIKLERVYSDKKQDEVTITGVVLDGEESQNPLPGVSISVKDNPSVASTTSIEGKFTIKVAKEETILFSMIGFETFEYTANEAASGTSIFLKESSAFLDEVVVVGYGTQKKINLTGSVSSINAEELESRPVTNIGKGLQGQMSGVTVRNTKTAPGAQAPNIRIRGIGTWGDANPLIVIDGIPGGDMNILNPGDIESISVLKDAASSSIYGVRGANGVVLVTTKKGKKNTAPTVSLNSYYGVQTPTALPKFLGSPDYMALQNEASINAGQSPVYSEDQIQTAIDGSDPNYFANTNWIDEVYKKSAPQQSHALNINGGGEDFNYFASYGYLGEGGLVVGDNFKSDRHNARLRMNTTLLDRLDIDANLGYVDRSYSGSVSGTGALSSATSIRPLVPVRFTNGSWGYHGGQSNPVAIARDGGTDDYTSQEVTANLSANLNLMEGLDLKAQYGLVKYNTRRDRFHKTINYYSPDDDELIYQTNNPNKIQLDSYSKTYQTFIGTLNYQRTFNDVHDLTGLLGASMEETIGNDFWASREGLPVQGTPSLGLGTDNQQNNQSGSENALQSLFGRVNYAYDGRYLFEANFRYDGSSRFAPEVRWDWFGSASAGWVFSEENFFEELRSVVSTGKIRVSYGTQGNDRVGSDYPYLTILNPVQQGSNNPIGDQGRVGFRYSSIPNRFVTWETSEKFNVGLDLSLLSNRLDITGEYFINTTKDILLNPPLPDVIGVGTGYPPQNSGQVENKGWELNLGWNDRAGDFKYAINFNLSDVKNRVKKLEGYATNLGDRVRLEGQPLDAFYGFNAVRIAQESDFELVDDVLVPLFPHQSGDRVAPGDLIYQPVNPDDDEITVGKDRHILGSDIPRYTYGLKGDLAWKDFDFSFFIQGVGKADGWLKGSARHPFINNSAMPQEVHLDRWTPENTDASYPRLVYLQTHNTRLSSKWIEDASYLRLKNIQIGYTLPERISEKFRGNRVRVFMSGENLFTKTNFYYGYDPEIPGGSNAGYYPQVKTFTFGLNMTLK